MRKDTSDFSNAVLAARPGSSGPAGVRAEPGIHSLGLGDGVRDGRLFIPKGDPEEPKPLLLLLHGAGADASSMLRLVGGNALAKQCVILAPDARKHTWDFLVSEFGPDVEFIERALQLVFERCRIDPTRIAIAGFSDGGSYALTLGLANGDLFTHVLAFSPGFMRPPHLQGKPRVFVSHGTADTVLPIDLCSRRIVPQLERLRYQVTYREFEGPHTVPEEILTEAMHSVAGQANDGAGSSL